MSPERRCDPHRSNQDALGLVTCLASPRRGWDSRPHVAVVRTVRGHELARVSVVLIPRFLASIQRTAIGRGVRANILNAIGSRVAVSTAEAEHDRVLVRTHDLGSRVEHMSFVLLKGW